MPSGIYIRKIGSRKIKDLVGQKFGRWIVIKKGNKENKSKDIYWLCKCDCGNEKEVSARVLKSNQSKSCGCLQKEIARKNGLLTKIHVLPK